MAELPESAMDLRVRTPAEPMATCPVDGTLEPKAPTEVVGRWFLVDCTARLDALAVAVVRPEVVGTWSLADCTDEPLVGLVG